MYLPEWEIIYSEILSDFDFSRNDDDSSARMLKILCMNSNLIADDVLENIICDHVTVFGNSDGLEDDIMKKGTSGTLISSGSAVGRILRLGLVPDIIVTDLDGDIEPQISANVSGTIAILHAHGDNSELIQKYATEFKGPVILSTQSTPDNILCNYGGFTDGDRCVCLARHFGARRILLLGFDLDDPNPRTTSDPELKRKKLQWAKKIIYSDGGNDIETVN